MRRAMIGLLLVALALTAVGRAASRPASGDLTAYQNIPLWEEGKVPLAAGTGRSMRRSSPCSCRPKASATARRS